MHAVVVLCVCQFVCVSVTTKSATYLAYALKIRYHRVLYGVFKVYVVCMALAKNVSFKNSGIICQSPLLFSLPDEFPRDRRDSDGFVSTKLVSRPSTSSYNETDLSLITLK